MDLLHNAAFVGGVLPLIFFGLMDFSFRLFVGKTPFQNVFFYTALGGFFSMIALSFTIFSIEPSQFFELFTQKSIIVGIGLGMLWALSILSMGVAYEKLNANASQIVPIASSSGIFTALLGIVFLGESLSLPLFLFSAFLIIAGITLLSQAEIQSKSTKSSLLSILLGGVVPLFGFGILNYFFKIYSELSPSILGIIMTITGMTIALCIQWKRKQQFIYNPTLLITGVFWALAVGTLGYGFWPLRGDVSILLPIVGASPLFSLLLVKLFLKEPVSWNKVVIGALGIVVGIGILNL